MCPIEPRFFSAEYNGLIAAPGTPKAMVTPSFSRIRTAASIARIFAMSRLAKVLALAAIFAVAGGDLNAGDFISRGVEGSGEKCDDSGTWIECAMEASLLSARDTCI